MLYQKFKIYLQAWRLLQFFMEQDQYLFQESLALKQPTSLADLFIQDNEYILQVEIMRIVNKQEEKYRKQKERDLDNEMSEREEKFRKPNTLPQLQFRNQTPLAKPLFIILAAFEGSKLIKFPNKTDKPLGKKWNAFFQSHNTHKHFINKCHKLRNQIEALIREEKLTRFVDVKTQSEYLENMRYNPMQEENFESHNSGSINHPSNI